MLYERYLHKTSVINPNAPVVGKDELEHLLEPGDVLLASAQPRDPAVMQSLNAKERVGEAIYRQLSPMMQGFYTHSLMYVGDGDIVEARGNEGVTKKPLKEAIRDLEATVLKPLVSREDRARAVSHVLGRVGEPYSEDLIVNNALSVALPTRAAARALTKGVDTLKADGTTCGTMLADAYGGTGIIDDPHAMMTPRDFLLDDDFVQLARTSRRDRRQPLLGRNAPDEAKVGLAAGVAGVATLPWALKWARRMRKASDATNPSLRTFERKLEERNEQGRGIAGVGKSRGSRERSSDLQKQMKKRMPKPPSSYWSAEL